MTEIKQLDVSKRKRLQKRIGEARKKLDKAIERFEKEIKKMGKDKLRLYIADNQVNVGEDPIVLHLINRCPYMEKKIRDDFYEDVEEDRHWLEKEYY